MMHVMQVLASSGLTGTIYVNETWFGMQMVVEVMMIFRWPAEFTQVGKIPFQQLRGITFCLLLFSQLKQG